MFGVFIRRWKPKRASDRNESPGTDSSVSPEPPDRPPLKSRQIHPEDNTQVLAYDTTYRRKSKPKSLPIHDNQFGSHLANANVALTPVYPLAPNICVEGGKIEFIKTPPDSVRNSVATPPASPVVVRGRREVLVYDEASAEKFDGDKELLERRVKQLEAQLEEEKRRTQKEKLSVAKLQNKLIKREGQARSDAERERRARGDTEARARAAEADTARVAAKLHAAQREIARMEETVRSLLQYKNRAETLKQEKSSLSAALEARSEHYQGQVSRLSEENCALRAQLAALSQGLEEAGGGGGGGGDYERCLDDVAHQVVRALLTQKGLREELGCMRVRVRELEAQNRALSTLLVRQVRPQVRPSPASPAATTPAPQRDLHVQVVNYETGGSCRTSAGSPPPDARLARRAPSSGSLVSFRDGSASPSPPPPAPAPAALSADDKRRHQILAEIWSELKGLEVTPQNLARALGAVDPSLWAPPERPITLNLNMPAPVLLSRCHHRKAKPPLVHVVAAGAAGAAGAAEDEHAAESPESGNKDEGYSTMSSDVQADSSRQSEHNQELEDLKEASDETDNQTIVSIGTRDNRLVVLDDATDADGYFYFPVNVSLAGNARNSYPPSKNILPFQHVMRSFSDSHLCLNLMTGGTPCGEHCFSIASPVPSTPGVLVFDLKPMLSQERVVVNPLRRAAARAALAGSEDGSERSSWPSTVDERAEGSQYDAEYVQHWLKLDDTRSALQQRHRDLADLEYDRAELEDWSLSLSCDDLRETEARRQSPFSEIATPGQISLSTLPSIREDNALEMEEDVGECLWNECGFMTAGGSEELKRDEELNSLEKNWGYSEMPSPGGSWSSAGESDGGVPDGKRSSAALSDEGECPNVGLNFTRDFYRLVKYESTKSLASNSSRGVGLPDAGNSHLRIQEVQTVARQDREQALQSVLNFIAEQQKYCRDREDTDSVPSSRPVSEIRELPPPYAPADFDDESVGPRSELSEERRRPDSCASFSDSCDIIVDERLAAAARYTELSPDIKMIPRFIDRDDSYSEIEHFYDLNRLENEENEIDERHLIKVHQKNEINRSLDMNNAANEIIATVLTYDSPVLPHIKLEDRCIDREAIRPVEHNPSALKENNLNIMAGLKQSPACSGRSLADNVTTRTSSFCFPPELEAATATAEEATVAGRRSVLGPVPEEEEGAAEGGSPLMTESTTTSTSTNETVILPSKKERTKAEKSRIPTLLGGKRPPCSPSRSKSKIPVPETSKTSGSSPIAPETPLAALGSTVPPSNIILKHSLSFHEAATSKDIIDELNRMIRQNENGVPAAGAGVGTAEGGTRPRGKAAHGNKDGALWAPTGWVHVERDIDFSDPKARANLLDVMLASSDSSPTSSCGDSSLGDCSLADSEEAAAAGYSRLHRLHRSRRQKKAAALKDRGMAVLRFSCYRRPSIIGREDFFVRYGKQEREAVASFDFLEQLSPGAAGSGGSTPPEGTGEAGEEGGGADVSQDSGKASQRSSERRTGAGAAVEGSPLSDSAHISYSGSERSFDDRTP